MPETAKLDKSSASAFRFITAYRIVSRAYFHLPIVTVFFVTYGFSPWFIALMLALYGVTAALSDLLLAPVRRHLTLAGTLVAGEVIKVTALVLLLGEIGPKTIAVSQALAGIGFSLTAGTDATLASSLRRGGNIRIQEPNVQMGMFLISFVAGVVGALSMVVWDRFPFALSAAVAVAAAAVVVCTRLKLVSDDAPRGGSVRARVWARMPAHVRFWTLYYSVNRALLLSAYTFLIPLLLFVELNLSLSAFGLVLGLYTLLGLAAAKLAPRLAGSSLLFYLTAFSLIGGLALMMTQALLFVVIGLALLGLAGGFIRPATMIVLAPAISEFDERGRHSVMRGLERTQGVIQAVLLVVSGAWVASVGEIGPSVTFYIGVTIVIQLFGSMLLRSGRKRQLSELAS